jgi:cytochrome b561
MAWRNTPRSFGLVTRILHWAMALLILGMLAFGTRIAGMEPGLANLWMYGLHKSLGLILLALVLIRLLWHRLSPPPAPLGPQNTWSARLARIVHGTIYLLLLAVPISGWVASSASGLDVMLFDRWVIPPIAPVSEAWENAGWAAHSVLTKLLMALLLLHVAGALKRQMEGDGTVTRMWRGRP